jgi:hypothetical protein
MQAPIIIKGASQALRVASTYAYVINLLSYIYIVSIVGIGNIWCHSSGRLYLSAISGNSDELFAVTTSQQASTYTTRADA